MQHNIVDLIVYLAKRMRMGDSLNEISPVGDSKYSNSELSAAFSWILQKYPSGKILGKFPQINRYRRLAREIIGKSNQLNADEGYNSNHRVLHYAERILITPEAYGYLLELVEIDIIDHEMMESIIDRIMFHTTERITLDSVKSMVQEFLFESQKIAKIQSSFLRGGESIN
jgi:hypothetical protein